MRKFSDMTGLHYTEKMNEALSRLETGEDPEAIEAEMGDALENEDPFVLPEKKETARTGVFAKRNQPGTKRCTNYERQAASRRRSFFFRTAAPRGGRNRRGPAATGTGCSPVPVGQARRAQE